MRTVNSLDVDANCRRLLADGVLERVRREAPEPARRSHGTRGAKGHLVRNGRGTLLRAAHPGSADGAVANPAVPIWVSRPIRILHRHGVAAECHHGDQVRGAVPPETSPSISCSEVFP